MLDQSTISGKLAYATMCAILCLSIASQAAERECAMPNNPAVQILADLADIKLQLNLTPTQLPLWQKAEDAMRNEQPKKITHGPQAFSDKERHEAEENPRAFAAKMDQEMQAKMTKMRYVRERWFILHDALSPQQKTKLSDLMQNKRNEMQKKMKENVTALGSNKDCMPTPDMPLGPPPLLPF
jgi:hypothetical protein